MKRAATFAYRPHPHLYEINTWAWLEQLSAKHGRTITLGNVPEREWDALKALGFDFIWLMGVWKRSPAGRRLFQTDTSQFPVYDASLPGWKKTHVVGSPYAIQAYRPDARIGTWEQLGRLHQKLRARRLGLILDFVPNHTAPDHPWVTAHPEYYLQGTEEDFHQDPSAFFPVKHRGTTQYIVRGRDPYFPPWPDTAQLNYFHGPTRTAMITELRKIAQYCDGVRCDMAMLVLNEVFARTWGRLLGATEPPAREFWPEALAAVPGFVWIAEVYWDLEWRLQQLGFQFTYDKRLYDRLRDASAREVYLHLTADLEYQSRLVRFLENHDEPRSAAVFGPARLVALGTFMATLPGMRFYHHGQLDGRRIRLPIQLSTGTDEPSDPRIRAFYEKILHLTNDKVFHRGDWKLLQLQSAGDGSFESLLAYRWRADAAVRIVVVNLGAGPAQGWLNLADEIDPSQQYTFLDQLTEIPYERRGEDLAQQGLYVRLEQFGAHLFSVSPWPPDR